MLYLKVKWKWKLLSPVWLFGTQWTIQSMEFSSQNTEVGCLSLLQGIFPTQRSNPGLPHCGQILYQLSHKGSPRILEWVAYPFSSRSSWLRNRTGTSSITGRFFTNWSIRKPIALLYLGYTLFLHSHQWTWRYMSKDLDEADADAQSCLTLCDLMHCSPPASSVLGDSPGKNTGVGCHVQRP